MERQRLLQKIPLTAKMIFITVIVGFFIWGVLDYFQTRNVKAIFLAQLEERLNQEAQEDRIRFDNYIKAHHQSAKLLTSQKRLIDYITSAEWINRSEVHFHHQLPQWLPRTSVLRALISIRHALLLDGEGKTWEIYQSVPEPLPESLLHPTELLRQLSHNQSFMTNIEGKPYLVTSESLRNDEDQVTATLMLASPIDNKFLIASQGTYQGRIFALLNFALLSGDKPAILISTEPDLLPSGTLLEDIRNRFLITGESLFDYGASDLLLGFASFVSTSEVESLTRSVIARDRQQRAINVFILILVFGLIMFWITVRISRLSARVSDFTEEVLHGVPKQLAFGDEMDRLEDQYQRLTEEVVSSQEIIRRDYLFQSIISSILQMALKPVSLTKQLNHIMRAILTMPFLTPKARGSIYLLAEDDPQTLILKAQQGLPESVQNTCARVPFGKCLCGRSAGSREIVFAQCRDDRHETICADMDAHGHYCIPIVSGQAVLGVINLYVEEDHPRDPDEEILLNSVANTLAGIIQRHQAQHEKQKLQIELAQIEKLSALGRLTANVAHEIRNPLTLVGGFARRMSKKHAMNDDEQKYLDIIISEVGRLEKILMNVLTFSKETILNLEYIDINVLINEIIDMYTDKLREHSIHLEKSYSADPRLMLDRSQMIGALSNLIANAIDAMPGGGTLFIASREEKLKGKPFLNLEIADTGAGIPEDKLDRIFEPFFTTKDLGRGTGLGLPICKKTIEDHGGLITITSRAGQGSTFTIHLPYSRDDKKNQGLRTPNKTGPSD
ncbi:MAG: ATP-binding protein [Desulfobulbaceae bacterium]|nr:ATP-binding protein [Desulfobulbaceae bacterium]